MNRSGFRSTARSWSIFEQEALLVEFGKHTFRDTVIAAFTAPLR
jgi:hypothetical protein